MIRRSGFLAAGILAVAGGVAWADDDDDPMTGQLKDGLVLHLPLDGNGQNKSKNQLDGEVCGAVPTDGHSGEGSSGLEFDGVDDYVDLNAALATVNALSWGSIRRRISSRTGRNNSLMVHPIHPNARPTAWFTNGHDKDPTVSPWLGVDPEI